MGIALLFYRVKRILFGFLLVGIMLVIAAYCRKISKVEASASGSPTTLPIAESYFAANPWFTYAHDGQRTSASTDGSITSLAEQWSVKGGTNSYHAGAGWSIADETNVWYSYSDWSSTNNGTGDYYALNKYLVNGTLVWANKRLGANHSEHYSPTRIGSYIFYLDDDLAKVDDNGARTRLGGMDLFGEILPYSDASKFFVAGTASMEGFWRSFWVRSYTYDAILSYGPTWEVMGSLDNGVDLNRGSMAYDNNKIFYAPNFEMSTSQPYADGIYALNESDGTQSWYKSTTPTGRISCGNSLVYCIEGSNLVARAQSNGDVSWQQAITGSNVTGQPPVVAGSLVIIATSIGVYAFNGTNGTPAWNTALANIRAGWFQTENECTVMAAALGSNTLVVTTDDGVNILDLTDGSNDVSYDPPSIVNRPVNPIIVGNRVYVSDGNKSTTPQNELYYSQLRLVCLQSGGSPPPADVIAPVLQSNISFSNVTTSSITASWTAATDNVSVSYYNFYYRQQGATQWITNNPVSSPTITISNLLTETTYEFYYEAVDGAGNISTVSATGTQATAANSSNPTTQLMGDIIPNPTTGIKNVHVLNWTQVGAGVTQVLQSKYKNNSYVTIYSGSNNFYSYVQPASNISYTYRVLLNGTYPSNTVTLKSNRR